LPERYRLGWFLAGAGVGKRYPPFGDQSDSPVVSGPDVEGQAMPVGVAPDRLMGGPDGGESGLRRPGMTDAAGDLGDPVPGEPVTLTDRLDPVRPLGPARSGLVRSIRLGPARSARLGLV
jgi:hypothetical protein